MRRLWLLVAGVGVACTGAKVTGDTGPEPAPPPDPCTLELPLEYDVPMPFWDRSVMELLGPHPVDAMAGTLVRPDGVEGELRVELAWAPHPRDAVQWQHSSSSETACSSVFSTSFSAGEVTVDGIPLGGVRAHGARLTSDGTATVELFADAEDVAGTILEPPSGRDAVCVWLRLLAVVPASPDQPAAWSVELWIDEDARWSTTPDAFPFAAGTLPWVAAERR